MSMFSNEISLSERLLPKYSLYIALPKAYWALIFCWGNFIIFYHIVKGCLTLYSTVLCCMDMDMVYESYTTIGQFPSPHFSLFFTWFLLRSNSFIAEIILMSSFMPSLFLFVDEEWHSDHNFMYTFYFYLLVTFNHYLLQPKGGSRRSRWKVQPLKFRVCHQLANLFLTRQPFFSPDWNYLMRTEVLYWPSVQQWSIMLVDLDIYFHSGLNLNAALHLTDLLCNKSLW